MLTVPTLMGHSTVDAKQDSMEMEVFATVCNHHKFTTKRKQNDCLHFKRLQIVIMRLCQRPLKVARKTMEANNEKKLINNGL